MGGTDVSILRSQDPADLADKQSPLQRLDALMEQAHGITSVAQLSEHAAKGMTLLTGAALGLVWIVAGEPTKQAFRVGQWGLQDAPCAKECPPLILQDLKSEGLLHHTGVARATLGIPQGPAFSVLDSVSMWISPTFGLWLGVMDGQPALSRQQSLSLTIWGRHIGALMHRLYINIDRVETESRYRSLIENIPAATYYRELDRPGELTYISPQIKDIIGYSPEEFIQGGQTFSRSLIHPEDLEFFTRSQAAFTQDAKTVSGSYRMIHRDGHTVWVLNHVLVIDKDDGRPPFMIGLFFDVTEFKELEEQFRHSQKMEAIGRLAGGIAHDFNNLLAVILGYSSLAVDDMPEGSAFREDIEEVIAAGERAKGLVSQLLTFSRRDVTQAALIQPAGVLAGLKSMYGRIVHSAIDFSITVAPDLGLVYADRGQLEQVLMNLLINACDAMPAGGKLTLEAVNVDLDHLFKESLRGIEPGEYVAFSVQDTGSGMTQETQEKIFDPFFTTKPVGKGTGLGLSTAHGIIKQSNGAIWVYSELGLGTTIKVFLPRRYDDQQPPEPAPRSLQVPLGRQERVLVVEDNLQLRNMLIKTLGRLGYQVHDASNGLIAQRLLARGERFDLVLSDVIMPGLGGIELMLRIQQHSPDQRFLLMSGHTGNATDAMNMEKWSAILLRKPFTAELLAQKVYGMLNPS